MAISQGRLLREREVSEGTRRLAKAARPARSMTINVAGSALGLLLSHGHVTQRQFDAGERLRSDWERAQLAPRVTMAWDAAPIARGRGG